MNIFKRLWNFITGYKDPVNASEIDSTITPEVLAFARWLSPVTVNRDAQYQKAFYAVLRGDPLPIKCMHCDHEGIFYHKVSRQQDKLTVHKTGRRSGNVTYFKKGLGERLLLGKCQNCGVTGGLQIPTIINALEKRKKQKGALEIPDYILGKY